MVPSAYWCVVMVWLVVAGCSSERPKQTEHRAVSAPDVGVTLVQTGRVDLDAWRAGCERGVIEQCELLANQYAIAADPQLVTKSLEIFETACGKGSLLGCYAAGAAYLDGNGVPEDRDRGHGLLRRGCALGHYWACERLK